MKFQVGLDRPKHAEEAAGQWGIAPTESNGIVLQSVLDATLVLIGPYPQPQPMETPTKLPPKEKHGITKMSLRNEVHIYPEDQPHHVEGTTTPQMRRPRIEIHAFAPRFCDACNRHAIGMQ